MKEPVLKETFIYILISGNTSELGLHLFDPNDDPKALGEQASQAAPAHSGSHRAFCPIQPRKWSQGISLFDWTGS